MTAPAPGGATGITIRPATHADGPGVRDLYLAAFTAAERARVAKLAVDLLSTESAPPTRSLLAMRADTVVGHIAFSPVTIRDANLRVGYLLAPLAVHPDHQKRGVGTLLVETGLKQLADRGAQVVLVYGDPAYYGRFGFRADHAEAFRPPYPLQFPFGWQALHLQTMPEPPTPGPLACVAALNDPTLW